MAMRARQIAQASEIELEDCDRTSQEGVSRCRDSGVKILRVYHGRLYREAYRSEVASNSAKVSGFRLSVQARKT